MDILLTGVSSFLGRHLATHLVAAGHTVFGTYHNGTAPLVDGGPGKLVALQLDLTDTEGYTALPGRIDALVHVAGVSLMSGASRDDMMRCNVHGTQNLIRFALAAKANKAIYTSTLSIHGQITVPIVDEATPVVNPDDYGATKYLAERRFAEIAGDLPSVAIRLPGVLGHGAHYAWIPKILEKIKARNTVKIYNPDNPFNNAAHVDDLGPFVSTVLDVVWTGFEAMPVGAASMMTVREVVARLGAAAGIIPEISIGSSDQPGFTISSALAMERFGYRPMDIATMIDRYAIEA